MRDAKTIHRKHMFAVKSNVMDDVNELRLAIGVATIQKSSGELLLVRYHDVIGQGSAGTIC